jgi:NADH-quinone oxidoreductase subunit C
MSEAPAPKSSPAAKVETKPKVSWGSVGKTLKDKFNCYPQPTVSGNIEAILLKDNSQFVDFMKHLKSQNFPVLLLINVVEYKEAFQLIYQLQSVQPHSLICIKINVSKDNPEVSTLTGLWQSANWYEREMWDLHGIRFVGHPNLTRLLNPSEWSGFPMRKDYIHPLDALNGPIAAVKGNAVGAVSKSNRSEIEIIDEPNQPLNGSSSA